MTPGRWRLIYKLEYRTATVDAAGALSAAPCEPPFLVKRTELADKKEFRIMSKCRLNFMRRISDLLHGCEQINS